MRNLRAEKYLLLRSLVRTVAATRVSVQIRELKIGGRREIFPPDPLTSGKYSQICGRLEQESKTPPKIWWFHRKPLYLQPII